MPNYNFPLTSRYYQVPVVSLQAGDGREIRYLSRRFVPPPSRFALLRLHVVTEGERLDLIAARELGDPEAFWRICDGNGAMRAEDLTATPGRRVRITLPEGIPVVPGS